MIRNDFHDSIAADHLINFLVRVSTYNFPEWWNIYFKNSIAEVYFTFLFYLIQKNWFFEVYFANIKQLIKQFALKLNN
jgi:hypothetical protein